MRVLPRLHFVAKFIHLQHWQHLHATLGKMCDSGDPIHLIRPIQWLPHHYGHVYTLKGGGTMEQISILLGPPGCAQVFPYLSPGPLDFFGGMKNNE